MSNTICKHNMTGQALVPGVPTHCRGCGALIEPTPRAGNIPSQVTPNALYPGDGSSTDATLAFSQ